MALDNALTERARLDPQQSQIVEMRFFGGLSIEDTAEVMGVSGTTVKRDWATALAWIREMSRKEARATPEDWPRVKSILDSALQLADPYSGLGDRALHAARQSGESSAKRRESLNQARAWYLKSSGAWHRVEHPLPVAPSGFAAGDPTQVAKKLQLGEAALAKLAALHQETPLCPVWLFGMEVCERRDSGLCSITL